MKNKILSACVAALVLAGCNETPAPKPLKITPTPIARTEPVASFIHDGGQLTREEPEVKEVDPLAVEHEHKGKIDHVARAQQLKAEGDTEGALAEARRQIADLPGDEDALNLVARLAKSSGQNALAAMAYGRLGDIRVEDAMPRIQEGRVRIAMKDFAGAVKAGNEAVARDAGNPEGYQVVGRAHLGAGKLDKAIESFRTVVEIKHDHGFALNNLGFAYLRANENQKALEALTEASELLPNVAYVFNNLGVAQERLGMVEDARLSYAKATSLSPKYVKAKVNSDRVARAPTPDSGTELDVGTTEEKPMPELEMPQE